ncbi:hypothetical protein IH992_19525 [Candidatus Poribacteria bacterium]|nr:hypothetical protein [Candidatus Poribacteria bacterium]
MKERKEITDKQIQTILGLMDVEKKDELYQLSRADASELITKLIDEKNGKGSKTPNSTDHTEYIEFNAARLGQAANLATHGRGIDYFLDNKQAFVKRVIAIYGLLCEAERGVKACSHHYDKVMATLAEVQA